MFGVKLLLAHGLANVHDISENDDLGSESDRAAFLEEEVARLNLLPKNVVLFD
jgi:hypothetical protein